MGEWPAILALVLTIIGSIVGYFTLQMLAAIVAFLVYGSSDTGSAKWVNIGALFVAGQLLIVSYLFYRKVWLKSLPALLLALLTPLGLFLALDGSSLLSDK